MLSDDLIQFFCCASNNDIGDVYVIIGKLVRKTTLGFPSGEKQNRIFVYMADRPEEEVSLDDIVSNCKVNTAYGTTNKYLSQTMSKMVTRGVVQRVRPGIFKASAGRIGIWKSREERLATQRHKRNIKFLAGSSFMPGKTRYRVIRSLP
jgi:hypothetical protein